MLSGLSLFAPSQQALETPHWTSILPPLVAIGLALAVREVIGSLLLGIYVGSLLLTPDAPGTALVRLPTDLMLGALADSGHAAIILFSLMLGAMVGVLAKSGAMTGIVRALGAVTKNRRGGMLVSWIMGLIIFFDDYANTLLVGNTLRPYTDKLKISRAKLAYIVDSTAAPVASIAVISTWVGFQIGLIRDAAQNLEGLGDAYILFLRSIPYSSYSLMALMLVASVAAWGRDIGPMRKAETNALSGQDKSLDENAGLDESSAAMSSRRALTVALVPIALVIIATFIGLYLNGVHSLSAGAPLFAILGAADSSAVLLGSSFLGMLASAILAVSIGRVAVQDVSNGLIDGIKAMVPAMVILLLAWSLGEVTGRLDTAGYVIEAVSGNLKPSLLPATLFIISSLVAFSTGTSWGAMAIIIPIAIPLAHTLPLEAGSSAAIAEGVMLSSVGGVLAGAVFGDHCSPISDTTILSSMASGCRHIDHVSTQIPYALIAGGLAILFGYLPSGFGIPPWIGLLLAGSLIAVLPRWFKRID
jgi:Na+/H+ antiporter NhaC